MNYTVTPLPGKIRALCDKRYCQLLFLEDQGSQIFFPVFTISQWIAWMDCNPLILTLTIKLILKKKRKKIKKNKLILSLYYLMEKISRQGEIFVFISLTVIITHLSTGIKPHHPSHQQLVYRIYRGRVVSSTVSETHQNMPNSDELMATNCTKREFYKVSAPHV